ncbi:hypothetical protein [Capnocytophaga felis]|uniref:Lipoprotein n=1 Tax=Capnocytophaga felis TaxID=2267611 RepID=A0A5M4B9H7_9FLAO|nr:hypothetical protein [Capnocytophaga felis]GET46050.1 hypothetical protein RCZ01_13520 [Capnocytophaga felis]GET48842.1 hypothetical protein RCZ02_16730 [Capnocytophaga felis]
MRKISFLIGIILTLGISSCAREDNVYMPESVDGEFTFYKSSDLEESTSFVFSPKNKNIRVKFEAFIKDDILHSTLFFRDNSSSWNKLSNFKSKIRNDDFIESIYSDVKIEGNSIKKNLDYEKIRNIDNILDAIPEKLFEEVSREEYYKESTLSLFYHLSSIKSAKRSFENKTNDCNCSFYANSFDEKSPFFCEEDKPINATSALILIKDLSESKRFAGKKFDADKTLNYLEHNKNRYLPASKIDRLVKDEFILFLDSKLTRKELQSILPKNSLNNLKTMRFQTVANSKNDRKFPYDPFCLLLGVWEGSDCGCCSNYRGPCFWCSPACLLHDVSCVNCDWWCGWKCVPGPC